MRIQSALIVLMLAIGSGRLFAMEPQADASVQRTYDVAIRAYNEGREDDAKLLLENVVKRSSRYPVASLILGKIHYKKGAKEVAEKYFRKSADASSSQTRMYSLVMLTFTVTNEGEAIQVARRAAKLAPEDQDVRFAIANALTKRSSTLIKDDDLEDAVKALEEAVRIHSYPLESRTNLSYCYLEQIRKGKRPKDQCAGIGAYLDFVDVQGKKTGKTPGNYETVRKMHQEICH